MAVVFKPKSTNGVDWYRICMGDLFTYPATAPGVVYVKLSANSYTQLGGQSHILDSDRLRGITLHVIDNCEVVEK